MKKSVADDKPLSQEAIIAAEREFVSELYLRYPKREQLAERESAWVEKTGKSVDTLHRRKRELNDAKRKRDAAKRERDAA